MSFLTEKLSSNYFFLYPVGHFGLTAVIFFVSFPLMQVIEVSCLLISLKIAVTCES